MANDYRYYFNNPELEERLMALESEELLQILSQSDTNLTEEQYRLDYDHRELAIEVLINVADGKTDINLIP